MSNLYHDLKVIGDYLSRSLKRGKIIFNKEHIKTNDSFEPLIKNSLFEIFYREDGKEQDKIKKIFYFRFDDLENTFIAKHLIKYSFEFELFDYDDKNYYFETNGIIPFRWLLIIKDFYYKNSFIEELEEINYYELLKNIPPNTLEQILINSRKTKITCRIEVGSLKNYPWYTLDGRFSDYAKSILHGCNSYLSLCPSSNYISDSICGSIYTPKYNYNCLFASEGGIEIFNKFIEDYIKFNHNYHYAGSIRNELKGNSTYYTSKDVNLEELLCLQLALKDKGVLVSEIIR